MFAGAAMDSTNPFDAAAIAPQEHSPDNPFATDNSGVNGVATQPAAGLHDFDPFAALKPEVATEPAPEKQPGDGLSGNGLDPFAVGAIQGTMPGKSALEDSGFASTHIESQFGDFDFQQNGQNGKAMENNEGHSVGSNPFADNITDNNGIPSSQSNEDNALLSNTNDESPLVDINPIAANPMTDSMYGGTLADEPNEPIKPEILDDISDSSPVGVQEDMESVIRNVDQNSADQVVPDPDISDPISDKPVNQDPMSQSLYDEQIVDEPAIDDSLQISAPEAILPDASPELPVAQSNVYQEEPSPDSNQEDPLQDVIEIQERAPVESSPMVEESSPMIESSPMEAESSPMEYEERKPEAIFNEPNMTNISPEADVDETSSPSLELPPQKANPMTDSLYGGLGGPLEQEEVGVKAACRSIEAWDNGFDDNSEEQDTLRADVIADSALADKGDMSGQKPAEAPVEEPVEASAPCDATAKETSLDDAYEQQQSATAHTEEPDEESAPVHSPEPAAKEHIEPEIALQHDVRIDEDKPAINKETEPKPEVVNNVCQDIVVEDVEKMPETVSNQENVVESG